ncbi:MAG: hypothetical protein CMP86_06330 [Gammaproteobacteria bacterium]|nr:hypothetical protein [Gammaproteobacteria bacterium]
MTTTPFSDKELANLKKYTTSIRSNKITRRMEEILSQPFYQELSDFEKHKWLKEQVANTKSKAKVSTSTVVIGFIISTVLGVQVGGFIGFVAFLIGIGVACCAATSDSNSAILIPFYSLKINELDPIVKEESRKEQQRIAEEKVKEERALIEELNEKRKNARARSQEIFDAIKKDPSLISSQFEQYKEATFLEINTASPDQEHIDGSVAANEFMNGILIGAFGVWTGGYIPANDAKCKDLINLLTREKKRIRELANSCRLPFIVIDYYQQISRNYYGLHRDGGNATIYDEQLITNEVMAMKESLVVQGDYHDKSMHLDRSVNNTTHIAHAVVEDGKYDDQRIKKEILKIILSSEMEAVSRVELMANIPVKESRLLSVLEDLQHSGTLLIGNRDSGEIIYQLDRLG